MDHPFRVPRSPAALLLFALLCAGPAPAQRVRLVADVLPAPGVGSMDRSDLVVPGVRPGEVWLVLDDGVHGSELWRSDGTAAGTALVADVTPGAAGTDISWVVVQGTAGWFLAGRTPQQELWRSDGTAAGTTRVLTTAGLFASSLTTPLAWLLNGDFLLGVDGRLARSDGTAAGTAAFGPPFDALYDAPGGGFFTLHYASGDVHRTDGTAAGTALAATGVASALQALGGLVVTVPGAGVTTFRLLGAAGTPAITLAENAFALSAGDAVVIFGTSTLWRWDGTGTAQVLGAFAALVDPLRPAPVAMLRDRSAMLFLADDGVHGVEPWWTDFTPAGTRLVTDFTAGAPSSSIRAVVPVQHRFLFWAQTPALGSEPWATDGTAAGTALVGDLEPGPGDSTPDVFSGAGAVLGSRRLVFPIHTTASGYEPWVTDGTARGTVLLADVQAGPGSSTAAFGFWGAPAGTTLVFAADDGTHGREPWAIDMEGAASPLFGGCRAATQYLADDPVIGAPWRIAARDAAAPGVALLALPARRRLDLGERCTVALDPATSVTIAAIVPDPLGRWSAVLPIPNDPALRGAAFVTQAAFVDPARPLGVAAATPWWLTAGY